MATSSNNKQCRQVNNEIRLTASKIFFILID